MKHKTRVLFAALAMSIMTFSVITRAGELTVYTSLEEDDAKVYLDAFAKVEPGIKVNMLRLSTGDLGARMLAEKSNPQHDIIWGWAVTQMVDPRIMEMLEAYKPTGIDKVNTDFVDSGNKWFATTGYFAAFCVNTEVLKKKNLPMPSSWQDLLNPVYKDQLIMPNPASSGTGYLQISSILQMKGEDEGWKFLHELDKNMGQYIKSGSKPCKLTRVGEYAVGASFAFVGVKSIDKGFPIKLVIPSEGAGYEMEVSGLMKTSDNKSDAKKFLDWLLTKDAGALYGERAAMSVVPGAVQTQKARDAGLPSDVASVLYDMDFDWSATNKSRVIAKWKAEIER
ncbi:ABC transporter substrate-binding protein [Gammaproteobacteria bacterium]|nr:ABC transporter substrate-binding protein [Gammaproteobacteria bacterium]